MRVSQTATFDVAYTVDPVDYAAVITQNLRRDQVPSVIQWHNANDNLVWYVEVTLDDYLRVAPDMDVESDEDEPEPMSTGEEDMEVEARTNTYGLLDNCYYVTAAALRNTTVENLLNSIEIMQESEPDDDYISTFFVQCGLSGTYHSYYSFDDLEDAMAAFAGGSDKNFAVSFERGDGSGHVVVGKYDATSHSCEYLDYQEGEGEDAYDDVEDAVEYALYPQ